MNFKLKALAAAALVAASGIASAAIDLPSTGDSELILVAYDPILNITYVRDLGTNIAGFNGTVSGGSISLDGWSSFTSLVGDLSNVRWGVVSGDGVTPITASFTAVQQAGNGTGGSPNPNQGRVSGINTAISTIINAHNSLATQQGTANGWSVYDSDTVDSFQGTALFGTGSNFGTGFTVSGLLNQDLYFYRFASTTVAGSTRTAFGNQLGQGVWSLNEAAGTLQYTAPVPEPGTYALMLAGLLTLGAVARRRTK